MSAKTNFSHTPQEYWNMFIDGIRGYKLQINLPADVEDENLPINFIAFLAGLAYEKDWATPKDSLFGCDNAKLVSPKIYNKFYPELTPKEAKKEFTTAMKLFVEGVNSRKIDDCGLLADYGLTSNAEIRLAPTAGFCLSSCDSDIQIFGTFVYGQLQIGKKKYINITPDILELANFTPDILEL